MCQQKQLAAARNARQQPVKQFIKNGNIIIKTIQEYG
jgi:hypothetical protein